MNVRTPWRIKEKVVLAHQPPFRLGALMIDPPMRRIAHEDGREEILEQRVMQVLVALARAEGDILARDELVSSCWNGRIVGDDAINRVMSRLRRVAAGIGDGGFRIETITKVGYRLRIEGGGSRPRPAGAGSGVETVSRRLQPTRRTIVLGAAAGVLGAACGGALLYRHLARPSVAPEVQALIAQAEELREQNTREGQYQAIGLLRRAVELAPDHADGWGMLGIAYGFPSHYRERAESEVLRARAEAAGRRALELDPDNAYGELALAVALPFIGHWHEWDRRVSRALAERPDNDYALQFRAITLQIVGCSIESVPFYERLRQRPLMPTVYNNYIRALWSAGRIEETERAMQDAASLYPTQATIWTTRFNIWMYSGRANAAIALAQDAEERPGDVSESEVTELLAVARAIRDGDPARVDAVVATQIEKAREAAFRAEHAIRNLSALQRPDEAFAIAAAYYFARGFTIPDRPGPRSGFSPEQRRTQLLFEPVTRPMRTDPRFERLVEEIGLARYWRESGVQPDYRRRGMA